MKKAMLGLAVFVLFFAVSIAVAQEATTPAPAPATGQETAAPAAAAAGPTVARMEIAGSVENREPVNVAGTFPASTEKVYCYVELKDVPEDTSITFVWSLGQNEMGKVTQQIRKSARWRTWSSKLLGGLKGDWKVDLEDASGAVLKSATFKVE